MKKYPGQLRCRKSLFPHELAKKAKVSLHAIRRYENGLITNADDRRCLERFRLIAKVLGCSVQTYKSAVERAIKARNKQ